MVHWDMSCVRLTWIYGLNQKSDQKMGYNYSYILCYVDDILCIKHNVDILLQQLHKSFPVKLGYDNQTCRWVQSCARTKLHNWVWAWAMSPVKYVQEAVRKCAATVSLRNVIDQSSIGMPRRLYFLMHQTSR